MEFVGAARGASSAAAPCSITDGAPSARASLQSISTAPSGPTLSDFMTASLRRSAQPVARLCPGVALLTS